ncbi:MAG TPA: tyrosine-type recombinase/integrase [Polyangiaceae bacterium]|nr:tyrosine-type recombinase/integrase [Polyangiaceae bacterium]
MTGETDVLVRVPQNGSITIRTRGIELELPELVAGAGQRAAEASFEFFTARIPNEHTRDAYGRAFQRFAAWCMAETPALRLDNISPPAIAAYLRELEAAGLSVASRKLHLAALRHWLDWLCQRGVLPFNPAASVRGPKLVVREGKTPVLEREQARRLFDSIGDDVMGLRDKGLLALMLFGFVRVSAVCKMQVRDFEDAGGDAWLVLQEKGGRERRIPCHHQARDYVRAYLATGGIEVGGRAPLFQTLRGRTALLTGNRMRRTDVLAMVKRRCADAGLPPSICNHSFRATGITIHRENGGRLEDAQELAGHADMRTTKLYDRTMRTVVRAEVERVQL